jgi:hypothetical protein
MPQFARQIVNLSGFPGAPGVLVFHYMALGHGNLLQAEIDGFYEDLVASLDASDGSHLASGVTASPSREITIHDVATGDLEGVFTTEEASYTLTGSGDGAESRATCIGMQWGTEVIRNGKRVKGRTFFGPASSAAMQSDGTIAEDIVSGWPALWNGIYDAEGPRLIVWSRPVVNPVSHAVIRAGDYADVTSLTISQMPFSQRGRR